MTTLHRFSLREALDTRHELGRLIVVAALLAIAVNLVSGEIATALPEEIPLFRGRVIRPAALWLGIVLLVACLALLARVVFRSRVLGGSFAGFIVVNRNDLDIVPIRGYGFSNELRRALKAVFLENKALESMWQQHPISTRLDSSSAGTTPEGNPTTKPKDSKKGFIAIVRQEIDEVADEPRAAVLLREALEYLVLERLSTHLRDHFEHESASKMKLVKEFKREDVPHLLLQNRVLSLLCTPIEDRAVFADSGAFDNVPNGEVHLMLGPEGQVFSRFDLILPTNTTISRPEPGLLRLTHDRIVIDIRIVYDGFSANIPADFLRFYAGIPHDAADVKRVRVNVEGRVPRWSLLRSAGWEYYRWFDSFADTLDEFLSREAFLKRINWDALSAQLFVSSRLPSRPVAKREAPALQQPALPPPPRVTTDGETAG